MQEKHKVMGEVVRKLWPDQERCVDGIHLGNCWKEPWMALDYGAELLAG